jgi:transcriptional regulator with XRE-family HTH domain
VRTKINKKSKIKSKKAKNFCKTSRTLLPMKPTHKLTVEGPAITAAREAKSLTQQTLAIALDKHRAANPGKYPKSQVVKLDNSKISKLESGAEPLLSWPSVKLLAEVLEIGPRLLVKPGQEEKILAYSEGKVGFKKESSPSTSLPVEKPGDATYIGRKIDRLFVDLPFISVPARAGFCEMCGDMSSYPSTETRRIYLRETNPPMPNPKNAVVFEVDGDSMEPYLESGDEVTAYLVPESRWDTVQNCIVVVSYTRGGEGFLTIKKVIQNDLHNGHQLVLRPYRDELAPLTIRRIEIRCVYLVDSAERRFKVRL